MSKSTISTFELFRMFAAAIGQRLTYKELIA